MDNFISREYPIFIPKVGRMMLFEDDYITNWIRTYGYWETGIQNVFDSFIFSDSVVFDIGAHVGLHSIYMAKRANTVYSFEPVDPTYQLLSKNIQLNRCKNIYSFPIGLSDSTKTLSTIKILADGFIKNSGCARIDPFLKSPENYQDLEMKIQLESLDGWMEKHPEIKRIDLMKIDVEGHEKKLLLGAKKTIQKFQPTIIMENFDTSQDILLEWNYNRTRIDNPPFVDDYLYLPQKQYLS